MRRIVIIASLTAISFSGHPQSNLSQSLGSFTSLEREPNGVLVHTDFGTLRMTVYAPNIVRVRASQDGRFDDFTYAVVQDPSGAKFSVDDGASEIILHTDSIDVRMSKNPVRIGFYTKAGAVINQDEPAFGIAWIGSETTCYKHLQPDEKFIGLGEKTGGLNRFGNAYVNWNKDYFGYPADGDPLYQTTPFYIGIHDHLNYGIFFDNSYKSTFNFGASNNRLSSFSAVDGEMNYYFIYHKQVKDIITSYTWLTGRMEMPPLWSLGFQQCRYSYYPDTEVLRIARTFREKSIPADAIYLDIHYMDAYKIFTWNSDRFPHPKQMLDELKGMGFHTVVIVDPGIKVEKGYTAYEQGVKDSVFLTYPDHTYYTGQVWPGWCHFPDFTSTKGRTWWGQSFKGYVEDGIEGFWNDMNEPATWGQMVPDLVQFSFEGNKGTIRRGHNIYGLEMARSTFEGTRSLMNGERPFILTRAGYSGIQRYSAVWTGDNVSTDDHMLAGVRLVNSMGLSGISYTGMDIAGFTGGASPQLYSRWVSLGTFTPLFRAHSMINSRSGEPWAFGEEAEEIARNYINLRYRLIPYLYSAMYQSHTDGTPVNRSLAINYTYDEMIYGGMYQNEFLFGPGILVAPSESYRELTHVYLPKGKWYDLYNDKTYAGSGEYIVPSPVDRLPVFVRESAIIPMESVVQNLGQAPSDTLSLHVYAGMERNSFQYYEDDGITYKYNEGTSYRRNIVYDPAGRSITLDKPMGSYVSKFRHIEIILHGFGQLGETITVSGKKQKVMAGQSNLMQPLSHFDPIGQGGTGESSPVKTFVTPNASETVTVRW